MSFKYIILYLNVIQITLAVSNYCAINFENVYCENTTMDEFKLLVDAYKNKINNLSIKYSDLKVIEDGNFIGYNDLIYLNLDYNNIINLNVNVFSNLSHLESLSMKNNSLNNLNQDVFNGLINVKFLYLDFNDLQVLPFRTFSKLIALEKLTLSHNAIRRITSNTFSGNNLLEVDLSYNKINTLLPYAFSYRDSKIESVDLSHNELTIIQPKCFEHLPNLINLNISNNKILYMDFVDALINIRYIDLSFNSITSISDNIIKLEKIEVLDLTNNFVTKLDLVIINTIPNLKELLLYNNRISCSWFKENYDNISGNVYLQNHDLMVLPKGNQNLVVYECFNEDNIPNMVLLKGTRQKIGNSEGVSESCEDANEFGFFEIYFCLSLGAIGVYTVTSLCANCLRRSEAHQNLRKKNMEMQSNEKATLYTFNVTRNGTLHSYPHSHIPNKIMINGSGSIDKRGYDRAAAKK